MERVQILILPRKGLESLVTAQEIIHHAAECFGEIATITVQMPSPPSNDEGGSAMITQFVRKVSKNDATFEIPYEGWQPVEKLILDCSRWEVPPSAIVADGLDSWIQVVSRKRVGGGVGRA